MKSFSLVIFGLALVALASAIEEPKSSPLTLESIPPVEEKKDYEEKKEEKYDSSYKPSQYPYGTKVVCLLVHVGPKGEIFLAPPPTYNQYPQPSQPYSPAPPSYGPSMYQPPTYGGYKPQPQYRTVNPLYEPPKYDPKPQKEIKNKYDPYNPFGFNLPTLPYLPSLPNFPSLQLPTLQLPSLNLPSLNLPNLQYPFQLPPLQYPPQLGH